MLTDTLYRYPKASLFVCIAICLAFMAGLQNNQISQDIRDNFDENSADLAAFKALEATYGSTASAMFLIEYPEPIFNRETLTQLARYHQWAEELPYAYRVNSIPSTLVIEADDDVVSIYSVKELLEDKGYSAEQIEAAVLDNENVVNNLVSESQRVAGIQVRFEFDRSDPAVKDEIVAALYDLRDRLRAEETNNNAYVTGSLILDGAQKEAVERNYGVLIPLVYLVMFVLLGALFRSAYLVLLVIGTTVLSILAMLGFAGFVGMTITPTSINAVSVLTGIVIAALCHVLVQISQRVEVMDYAQAVKSGMQINNKPIILASLTTFIAFLSMNTSGIPPLRDLGNLVAVGILFLMFNSLLLFPALLLVLKPKIRPFSHWQSRYFRRYGNWLLQRPKPVFYVISTLAVVFLVTCQLNEVRDYFSRYYDKSFEFRVANDFADRHLAGLYTLEFSIASQGPNGITDLDYLQDLARFTEWLGDQPEVQHVASLVDVMRRMNQTLHNDQATYERLPQSNELASQYLLVYEMLMPDPQSLTEMMDLNKSSTRVVASLPSLPSDELFALEQRVKEWLANNTEHFDSYYMSGLTYVFAKIFTGATVDSLESAGIALVLISIFLILTLRSLNLGLLSLIPNILPFVFAFGLWGIFNGDLILTTTSVIAITLGIVVDDTIHFLHKVQHFVEKEQFSVEAAIIKTLEEVGPAMVITTLAIGLGFFMLVFSAFLPTVHFGMLAAIILIGALILDITLLPVLLYQWRARLFPERS